MTTPVVERLRPFGVQAHSALDGNALRELVRRHQLVLLRDVPAELDLLAWCALLGMPMIWPFGAVLELDESGQTFHGHGPVPWHWDGMFQTYVPEFIVMHCVVATGRRARSVFSHTSRMLAAQDPSTVHRWRQTVIHCPIPGPEPGSARSPLVVPHPVTGVPTLRYMELPGHPEHAALVAALEDPRWHYAHTWRSGDLLIADNHTLLHGRESAAGLVNRRLRRVHVLGEPPHLNPAVD
ncbi:TauD/TfdA family dioxygenase [Pseudonocardiaceae bacterium YIM PH 21723]|nr:TauD/TfdA family dioxygenase [Pseudonocardiaceae bacterium YIM PH 21723]